MKLHEFPLIFSVTDERGATVAIFPVMADDALDTEQRREKAKRHVQRFMASEALLEAAQTLLGLCDMEETYCRRVCKKEEAEALRAAIAAAEGEAD